MCNRQRFQYKHKKHQAWKKERMQRKMEHWAKLRGWANGFNAPPVNILELDEGYELHLFAPQLNKEDFKISVVDNLLTIAVEKQKTAEGNWKRREYEAGDFSRQFELDEKIDTTSITAKYREGVLQVSLKKLEGFETSRSEITVA